MSVNDVLLQIQNSQIAHAISKTNHLVAVALQVIHVLGFILLLASLVLISLRLLNVVLKTQPLAEVVRDANRMLRVGLAMAVVSGVLMFISIPTLYYYKTAFELKMALFVVALLLQFTLFRQASSGESPQPLFTRLIVAASLVCWFSIGFAGRMIGFT